ncbi:MAG: hypothetical protein VR65_00380 [Desulfobulbaceae bacterium BRH_c16a]|nr:MAG: hypothetical protein VR65_00380 [Desulfobulbaceae bacterium BRH_c16a]
MKKETSMLQKIGKLTASLSVCLVFVYVFLPYLTESVGILNRMSQYLESNGIDPTRYYYTDVVQVKEAENYLKTVLDQ